ncbi:MAG: hypothetical protein H6606_04055 [Flavobacteriales bacterium]|nr:hypothetical protein [Flavobacteriales bacterium]
MKLKNISLLLVLFAVLCFSCAKENTNGKKEGSEEVNKLIDQDEHRADSMKKALGIE